VLLGINYLLYCFKRMAGIAEIKRKNILIYDPLHDAIAEPIFNAVRLGKNVALVMASFFQQAHYRCGAL